MGYGCGINQTMSAETGSSFPVRVLERAVGVQAYKKAKLSGENPIGKAVFQFALPSTELAIEYNSSMAKLGFKSDKRLIAAGGVVPDLFFNGIFPSVLVFIQILAGVEPAFVIPTVLAVKATYNTLTAIGLEHGDAKNGS